MKILIFFPIKESYAQLWEYYKNDKDILEDISSEIHYSNNFFSFLLAIFKVDCVYCWWWHSSILQIIVAKILKKKVVCTGAIHMFDYSGGETFFKKNLLYRTFIKISLYLADANLFITDEVFESKSTLIKALYKKERVEFKIPFSSERRPTNSI